MSGIAGLIQFDGAPVAPELIGKMTTAMTHRGPDGIRHWARGAVALGQCMLCTTPESLEEKLPLRNEDESLVLVMDGRVDNREDLRRALLGRGAVLRDRCDAELVLRAYEVWGDECPDRIIGELVFFVWDARTRRLFGARDAAGTRHFYYSAGRGWFGFASEIKGLLALGRIEFRLNESRVFDYLVEGFDRDDEVGTFYQNIGRIPAGHAISVDERGARTWRYWNPGNLPAARFASAGECAEAFLEQLRIAVKCRLRNIGPVAAMLSGGLDSSSIVGLISKEFRAELSQPLKTISLIREDRENCPDWKSIRAMLEDDWLDSTLITSATARDVCSRYLDGVPGLDEPFALSHGFVDSLVYEAARERGCRVVLDGLAGDLLFYGSSASMRAIFRDATFRQIPAVVAACRRHRMPGWLWELARASLQAAAPAAVRSAYRKLRADFVARSRWAYADDLKLLRRETARNFLAAKHAARYEAGFRCVSASDQSDHAGRFKTGLLSFAHEVYGEMAFSRGVEPRSPFSDRRMIEFAIRMPAEEKLFAPWYKMMLRKCMSGFLPEEVLWRRDIGGNPGWKFHEQLISEIATNAPDFWQSMLVDGGVNKWVDASSLRSMWDKYEGGADYDSGYILFRVAILANWMRARRQDIA